MGSQSTEAIALMFTSFYSLPVSSSRFHNSKKLTRTRYHLRRLNKPALEVFGAQDTIDCVFLCQQPWCQLQMVCKKHGTPLNATNIDMADALSALLPISRFLTNFYFTSSFHGHGHSVQSLHLKCSNIL